MYTIAERLRVAAKENHIRPVEESFLSSPSEGGCAFKVLPPLQRRLG